MAILLPNKLSKVRGYILNKTSLTSNAFIFIFLFTLIYKLLLIYD